MDREPPASDADVPESAPARRGWLPVTAVAWALTGINVLAWLAMELVGESTSTRTLIVFGAKVNVLIANGEYWRLLTPVFLHIGFIHLLLNSFALLSFGRLAETIYGHGRFLAIYLVSGVTGVLLSYLFSNSVSAGASGAIFGIAGALVVFYGVNRGVQEVAGQGQLGSMLFVLAINGVYGFVQPRIDNWGHAGGLLGGLALAAWLVPRVIPIRDIEGETVALRLQRSSAASWLCVPAVVAIVVVAVLVIPGRSGA